MTEVNSKIIISDESAILWLEKEIPKLKLMIYKSPPDLPLNSMAPLPLLTEPLLPDLPL